MTEQARTWTLEIPAPARMFSENTDEHWRVTSKAVKEWREASFLWATQAKLPKHLGNRVRVDVVLHFVGNRDRDNFNYHKYVVKPLVDGLCRPRTVLGRRGVRTEPGYQLVDDDNPRYLDGPFIVIGEKVPRAQFPYGLAVVTITELDEPVRPAAAARPAGPARPSRVCGCGTTFYGSAETCAACRRRKAIVDELLAGDDSAAEAAERLGRDRRSVYSHIAACMIGTARCPSAAAIAQHVTALRGDTITEDRVRAVIDTLVSDGYLAKTGRNLKIVKPLGAAA